MPLLRAERLHPVDRFFDSTLLGMLFSGFLALASTGELDPITLSLTALAFSGRLALLILRRRLELPAAWANAAVILYAAFYPLDYHFLAEDFLVATVRLICFLAVAKGLTVASNRDAVYAILIAFAELLAAALLSVNLLFFLFLSLFLFAGVATLTSWQIRLGAQHVGQPLPIALPRFSRRLLGAAFTASFAIVLFTVALFFVLPRTARAAFQNFVSSRFHLPGFSGNVRLGDIGTLQTSSRTMMHIKVEGRSPQILPYKWRGTALSLFDGQRWTQSRGNSERLKFSFGSLALAPTFSDDAVPRRRTGRRLRYQVQISESGLDTLFVAGVPEYLESNLTSILRQSNGALKTIGDAPSQFRYSVSSYLDPSNGDAAPPPGPEERRLSLSLPPLDPRVAALARSLTQTEPDDWHRARRLEMWLQTNLQYTLELPSSVQPDPIAHFLFDRKKGHCEYFASAHALMLRSLGVPTRVVTGFQGGTFNPVSGWHVVAASDAHSWVEAWIPNNGWTTFDPTPLGGRPAHAPFFAKLSNWIDAADLFWQDWILQYDLERQFKIAAAFDNGGLKNVLSRPSRSRQLRELTATAKAWLLLYGPWLFALVILSSLAWVLTPWLRTRHQERLRRARLQAGQASPSDGAILYRKLLDLLSTQGFTKPASSTPLEFARELPPSETANQVAGFTHAYHRFRFGADRAAAQQMLEHYDAIERHFHQAATEPSS